MTAVIECRSRCETVVGCAMAATVQTALTPRRASPIGGARVAGGAAIVTPGGGPLQSGAAVVAVAGGGALRVRQAVVTAAAVRLPATGEVGAGAGITEIAAGITAIAAEGRAAGRNRQS
ncbi:MAG TPA: hypothetical protein VEO58_01005 [Gemmatimonadales bacterium]|nr:hypothetical protein [Gemmatimonadales bacterium]